MLNDLIKLRTIPTSAASAATDDAGAAPTPLSRFARKMLVAISAVMALGLAGVVFARGAASEERPSIVWILRGRPIVAAPTVEWQRIGANQVVVLEAHSPAEPKAVDPAGQICGTHGKPAAESIADAPAQLAAAQMPPSEGAMLAKPQAARVELPTPQRIVMMEVTAYCPCTKCCGPKAQGITASGKPVSYNDGKFVAADRALPFGTKVIVPGYDAGQPVEVIDRGGAIKGDKLDVYFPTHQEALEWGRQKLPVLVAG